MAQIALSYGGEIFQNNGSAARLRSKIASSLYYSIKLVLLKIEVYY